MSASTDPDDVKTAYAIGAISYLHKPGSIDQLESQHKTLHDPWMSCKVPEVDPRGKHVITDSKGNLGERFKLVRVG